MADKIEKFLKKLRLKDSEIYRDIIKAILSDTFNIYDVKKISGYDNIFRIRKGDVRIIFKKGRDVNEILKISNRDENTYRDF